MLKANLNENKTLITTIGVMGEYLINLTAGLTESEVMENWLVEDEEGNRMLLPTNVNEITKICEIIINPNFSII